MTIKQQSNHGDIQKVCHLLNCIFHPIQLSHLIDFTLSHLLRYSIKIINYGIRERQFFVYMAASAYQGTSKEVENRIFRNNRIFSHTCMYKQPILTK